MTADAGAIRFAHAIRQKLDAEGQATPRRGLEASEGRCRRSCRAILSDRGSRTRSIPSSVAVRDVDVADEFEIHPAHRHKIL